MGRSDRDDVILSKPAFTELGLKPLPAIAPIASSPWTPKSPRNGANETARARLDSVDGLMAATAVVRGMTFVTRNTADVARTGVRLLDPFDADEELSSEE